MQDSVSKDREKYIGGSDIPIIMELSPFKSRFDLLLEKAGLKENDFTGNIFTEYGNKMEGKIRDFINAGLISDFVEGKHIIDVPAEMTEHPNGMQIRCHTDGECDDIVLEIKTTAQTFDSLDDYELYLVQILFYMYCTGKSKGLLAVYKRPDDMSEEFDEANLQLFPFDISDFPELVNRIISAVGRFLDDLHKVKSNPMITEEELLPSDITEITAQIIAFEQQLERMKYLEKKIKSEKDRLKTAMESAGIPKWQTPNGYKITLVADKPDKAETVESFDAERFMAENPELWEKYMVTSTVIKKGKKGYVLITAPKKEA